MRYTARDGPAPNEPLLATNQSSRGVNKAEESVGRRVPSGLNRTRVRAVEEPFPPEGWEQGHWVSREHFRQLA